MTYEMKILGGEEEINFTIEDGRSTYVKQVTFKLNTIDDNTLDRDANARCEFTVYGEIQADTYDETRKIANWAKDKQKVYRTLEISIKDENDDNPDNKLRMYQFDRVFCIDYTEDWGVNQDKNDNRFTLFMAQAEKTGKTSNII